MSKWVLDQYDGTELDYPTLGFRAVPDDILDATAAPDGRWSLNGDQGAAETVDRYTVGGDPSYVEPGDGHVLRWSDTGNAYVPTAPVDLLDDTDFAADLSATIAARAAAKTRRQDAGSLLDRNTIGQAKHPLLGDGSDGNATISTDTLITTDKQYQTLTINTGVKLTAARGVKIRAWAVVNNGTVTAEVYPGGNSTGNSQGAGPGSVGAYTGQLVGIVQSGGQAGGLGATGGGNVGGSSAAKTTQGGTGGAGGGGGNSGATSGGNGGTAGARTLPATRVTSLDDALAVWASSALATGVGGAAGGSGAGDGTNLGGGGGGGGTAGGFLMVTCGVLSGVGVFTAAGGAGGNGGNGAGGNAAGGGGGGGGGGGFCIVGAVDTAAWTGTVTAPGGAGGTVGTSAGTGGAAVAGSAGGAGFALLVSLAGASALLADVQPIGATGNYNAGPLFTPATSIDIDDAPVRFLGGRAEYFTAASQTFLRNALQSTSGTGWLGARNGRAPFRIDWCTDSPLFGVELLPGGGRYTLLCEGRKVKGARILWPGADQPVVLQVTNGTRKTRHYTLLLDEMPVGRFHMASALDTIHPPLVPRAPVTLVIADSRGEGNFGLVSYNDGDRFLSVSHRYARILGWDDNLVVDGEGGTGFLNDGGGSGREPFPDRIDFLDSIGIVPERIIFDGGGYNDGPYTGAPHGALVTAAAASAYAKCATYWPGVPLWQVFIPDRGHDHMSGTGQPELSAAVKAAAIAAPNMVAFIDGITGEWTPGPACPVAGPTDPPAPFLTGNGQEDALAGNGNCDLYRSRDSVHPNYAGHEYLGTRIAALISETLPY